MKRVLHVIRTDGLSGAEGHLCVLVDELRAEGWASDVLISTRRPDGVGDLVERLRAGGAGTAVIVGRHDLHPRLLVRLWQARRSGRWAVIHTHLVHADWHGGLAADLSPGGRPLVSSKHNHDPFRQRWAVRIVERWWTRRAAGVIAISESLGDFVEELTGRRPSTVRYGLAAGTPPLPRPRPVGAADGPSMTRLVGVGRLEPQKGFDVLIEAVSRVPGVALDILGAGSLEAELAAQIDRLGLAERVRLLGQSSDVAGALARADVFVHAARWEGFGLVLLEAMAAGLPVVATRVGAIPEVVAEGVTARLVEPDDAEGLARAIEELAGSPALREELGRAGHDRLLAAFAPARMAAETAAVYDEAIR